MIIQYACRFFLEFMLCLVNAWPKPCHCCCLPAFFLFVREREERIPSSFFGNWECRQRFVSISFFPSRNMIRCTLLGTTFWVSLWTEENPSTALGGLNEEGDERERFSGTVKWNLPTTKPWRERGETVRLEEGEICSPTLNLREVRLSRLRKLSILGDSLAERDPHFQEEISG